MNINNEYARNVGGTRPTTGATAVTGTKNDEVEGKKPPRGERPTQDTYVPSQKFAAEETAEQSAALSQVAEGLTEEAEVNADVVEEESESAFSALSDSSKISDEERFAIANQLKQEQLAVDARFMQMLSGMYNETLEGLGYLEITPEIQAEAQEAISEDGYWGVEATSERMFNFAMALSGDDPEVMAEMRTAFEKGFASAEKSWGGELPDIAYETKETTLAMFDQWEANYASSLSAQ